MTTKPHQRLRLVAVLSFAVLCLTNCAKHELTTEVKPDTVPSDDEAKLVLKSVDFYGWSGEGQNRKYVKLDKWEEFIKGVSNPATFDVACQIEYNEDSAIQEADYIALTTLAFLVGPDSQPPSDYSVSAQHSWSRIVTVNDMKMQVVPYLKSNEIGQLTFKDFDFGEEIKRSNAEDDILWLWAVKVNFSILDRDMSLITQGQQVLPLIPASNKSAR